jgi:hypothetical protein
MSAISRECQGRATSWNSAFLSLAPQNFGTAFKSALLDAASLEFGGTVADISWGIHKTSSMSSDFFLDIMTWMCFYSN